MDEVLVAGYKPIPPDKPLRLKLGKKLTVLVGPNAAGKTSVLEALHYASSGISFDASFGYKRLMKNITVAMYDSSQSSTYACVFVPEPESADYNKFTYNPSCYVKEVNALDEVEKAIEEGKVFEEISIMNGWETTAALPYKGPFFPADLTARKRTFLGLVSSCGISDSSLSVVKEAVLQNKVHPHKAVH